MKAPLGKWLAIVLLLLALAAFGHITSRNSSMPAGGCGCGGGAYTFTPNR